MDPLCTHTDPAAKVWLCFRSSVRVMTYMLSVGIVGI